jgi:hypothetical protein
MPGLNRKGPLGEGPRTGRGLGRCNPQNKGKTEEEILLDSCNKLSKLPCPFEIMTSVCAKRFPFSDHRH